VIKNRANRSRFNGKGLRGIPLPIRDGKLDLDAVASAAHSVGSVGQQVGDIASALQAQQGKRK
jgi:hypothetical protein